MNFKKIIKGNSCSLHLFNKKDEKLTDLIHVLFNDENIIGFMNPAYPIRKNRSTVKKWVIKTSENPFARWYVIKASGKYIGYVCFKWRKDYDEACEISTAILPEFRGLKLGYESSKILIDYVSSTKYFKYIVAYIKIGNKKAENNIRKTGLKKNNRLQSIITKYFYGWDGSSAGRMNNLFVMKVEFKPNFVFTSEGFHLKK
ncbi:hypothetical protein BH10BAC5_BH10BAC5_20500 [soil metagenome]